MIATITAIDKDYPRIDVRIGTNTYAIDIYGDHDAVHRMRVGQKVKVTRKANSPFVYLMNS